MDSTFQNLTDFAKHCNNSVFVSNCFSHLHSKLIDWNFISGKVSADDSCSVVFEADTPILNRKYHLDAESRSGDIRLAYRII